MVDLQSHIIELLKAVRENGDLREQVFVARRAFTRVYEAGFEDGARAEREDQFVVHHLTTMETDR
ncbi:hypothetical protein [Actinomadura madurae]|uniref:hypothetical protein n=1 Tax=Actinomadura madurae TaxID=1993 RepID=UPI0020D22FB9|nr:hypothetical protein [Actinomadura madurae]MCP9947221.1 hypothetical protein [Actinomadura madurae]MCP9963986.1 hypothetical protein [Actinomadura madurae]MCP9976461.1 hypothetical protein [Actinomadura madurae]MCQ0012046.1 hypothetical protein [Actinomadura madurae]MCQ0012654.1 hypothetical protein [Actinomadura madurae]